MNFALAVVRTAHLACLMTLFGAESMTALWRTGHSAHEGLPRWLLGLLGFTALITALLWLMLVVEQLGGGIAPAAIESVTYQTLFGRAMAVRLVLLALLAAATVAPVGPSVRVLLSGAALGAIAVSSHAAAAGAAEYFFLRAANDGLHLLAAGFWLGGLAVLARLIFAHPASTETLVASVRFFSRLGTVAVALLVVAGTFNAYLILFEGQGRWSATYLTLLAAKLVLAAIMIALALTNRLSLLPGLARNDAEARDSLTISVVAELVLGLLIVAIVGALGLLAPTMG